MDFLQKQEGILKRLKETDYKLFDGDKEDAMDFLGERLEAFPKYANVVVREQIMLPIWRNRFEGQDLRDKIMDIDKSRKIAHDNAISSVNILNRTCRALDLPPFVDIDTSDRYAVADFVGEYVSQVYNHGIGKTMDDATLNKTQEYDTGKIQESIKETEAKLSGIAESATGAEADNHELEG